jgi:hypothetical protein
MILYKYVNEGDCKRIINDSTITFTRPEYLNDIFETSAGHHQEEENTFWKGYPRENSTNSNYGVLSLTRNPLNPIMWSHYADEHKGFVIGIDCEQAGLNNPESYVLPAKHGSVIYTKTKPVNTYQNHDAKIIINGELDKFDTEYLEALQRIFLYKSVKWAYEEEIRVIKSNLNRHEQKNVRSELEREIVTIPSKSIVSIHIGMRNPCKYNEKIDLFECIKKNHPNIDIFACAMKKNSWELTERVIPPQNQLIFK